MDRVKKCAPLLWFFHKTYEWILIKPINFNLAYLLQAERTLEQTVQEFFLVIHFFIPYGKCGFPSSFLCISIFPTNYRKFTENFKYKKVRFRYAAFFATEKVISPYMALPLYKQIYSKHFIHSIRKLSVIVKSDGNLFAWILLRNSSIIIPCVFKLG